MKKHSVHGTPEQFESAVRNRIQELGGDVEACSNITASSETTYIDDNGVMGEAGYTWTVSELREYWDAEHLNDPVLSEYDSFESWLEDTLSFMSPVHASTDVNGSTNKTILSRLSKSGYTIKEVRKMFEDQTGLEMTSDHSREFNEWAEDFPRLIERSTNIEASINLSDDEIERYIHTLIGDIQSEFESTVDSMKFDTSDDSLIITAVLGNEVKEFTVPYSDLKFDWNNIYEDTQYISNEIDEEFNREYVDDVMSESSVNSASSKFSKVLGSADSNISDFEITEDRVLVKYNGPGGHVVIPNSVKSIRALAFYRSKSLTSIAIPDSVVSIGESAFKNCTALKSITLPKNMTNICDFAFSGCTSLKSVTIPDSVRRIGYGSFEDCSALTSVVIPDSVTSICDYAFAGCFSLTSINIPGSVTSIGDYAFAWCTALASVTLGNGVTSIGESAFRRCAALTSVKIPDSVTSIGEDAFYNCNKLQEDMKNYIMSFQDQYR